MHPLERIRTQVFRLDQAKFAAVAGATQGTVSRWERGTLEPSLSQLQSIRVEAERLGLEFEDRWFFERFAPAVEVGAQ